MPTPLDPLLEQLEAVLGLPLHPLVVHAVVVLVPLLTLLMALAAVSGRWADRLRTLLAMLAVVAATTTVLAWASGQRLLTQVPGDAAVAEHVDRAEWLHVGVGVFAALVLLWAVASRSRDRPLLAWLATGTGLVVTGWVVLVGHAGSVSVWGDVLGG
jgi:hypothetical protein